MGKFTIPCVVLSAALALLAAPAVAQPADGSVTLVPAASASAPAEPAASAAEPLDPAPQPAASSEIDKRIFGVLPNYRTADASLPFVPLTPRHKFSIAAKDTFDYPVYLLSGAYAGLYQLENQNPSFGQGLKGYGKRLAASYADQAVGNMMTEAIFPTLLHEDPRYFRHGAGSGSNWQRVGYAVTRVMVVRTDKGSWRLNYSEWLGNGAAVAISNVYYPSDTRTVADNLEKLSMQVGTDAFSQVLKEFWPDWKRHLFKK